MFNQVLQRSSVRSLHVISARQASYTYKAALVMHGNGVYDGTECTEAAACLVGLSRAGANVQVYAPNRDQAHVVNHMTGEEDASSKRNVMEESARIARGNVRDLALLKADNYDALIIPGGFGAAKNLSDFGFAGEKMVVKEDIAKVLNDFYDHKKVIGLTCIAPVLAAKALSGKKIKMTMGGVKGDNWPYAGASQLAESLGHNMITGCQVNDVVMDTENRVVTTPAYM